MIASTRHPLRALAAGFAVALLLASGCNKKTEAALFAKDGTALHDVNGDGVDDLVVGAPAYNGYQGRVCVFFGPLSGSRSANGANVTWTGSFPGVLFGTDVCVADVSGDGVPDVIVGAPSDIDDIGAVYVFYGGAGLASGPSSDADARIVVGFPAGRFGQAVAAGDVDGDGTDDVIASGPGVDVVVDDRQFDDLGMVFVFHGGADLPNATSRGADHEIRGELSGKEFGFSLDTGDFNGDGTDDILVGSPTGSRTAGVVESIGHAYVFLGPTTIPMAELADVDYWSTQPGDEFGHAVAAGHIVGLGNDSIVVGAPGGYADTGRVYVFFPASLSDRGADQADVFLDGLGGGWRFGSSVAVADVIPEDIDGGDVIVGAPGAQGVDPGKPLVAEAGLLYIFAGGAFNAFPPAPGNQPARVSATINSIIPSGAMGTSVSACDLDGDQTPDVVAGAPAWATDADDGRVYVFRGGNDLLPVGVTREPTDALATVAGSEPDEAFGAAVGPR